MFMNQHPKKSDVKYSGREETHWRQVSPEVTFDPQKLHEKIPIGQYAIKLD